MGTQVQITTMPTLPKGRYVAQIIKVVANPGDNPRWANGHFRIVSPNEFAGREIDLYHGFPDDSPDWLYLLVKGVFFDGGPIPPGHSVDPDELTGLEVEAEVDLDTYPSDESVFTNCVREFFPVNGKQPVG